MFPDQIETEIFLQDKSIDVLASLGSGFVLLIEDKTGTRDHSGQLKRYYDHVINGQTKLKQVHKDHVFPIYLKTGNLSKREQDSIEKATTNGPRSYKIFERVDFLRVLKSYTGSHPILVDFRDHLQCKEKLTKSFCAWKDGEQATWAPESWEGFFRYLEDQDKLTEGSWWRVPNSSGLITYWWNYIPKEGDKEPQVFLQIEAKPNTEDHKLCFKIRKAPENRNLQKELKLCWRDRIKQAGADKVDTSSEMRTGKVMNLVHWKGEWMEFSNGTIDIGRTVDNLVAAQEILCKAAQLK